MAKKVAKPAGGLSKPVPLALKIEESVRRAIDQTEGVRSASELAYIDAVEEAFDSIMVGLTMRRQELEREGG